jgi:hypothetical protein
MEQIYKNTPLSKDICKLVFNYINYTSETLQKLIDKNKELINKERTYITNILKTIPIIDLLLKSISIGYVGFYIKFGNAKSTTEWMKFFKQQNNESLMNIENNAEYIDITNSPFSGGETINVNELSLYYLQ